MWSSHKWWWLYATIHLPIWFPTQHGSLQQVPEWGSPDLEREGSYRKTICLANGLQHITKIGVPSVGCQKISVTISPKTYCRLIPQITIPLDYCVWSAVEREINKTPGNIKDKLKARLTAIFTNLNKTVGKACRRFWSRLEAVVKANGNFFK